MNHFPRKRWGQHFLSDKNLLNKLVGIIDPHPDDTILEIGPGEGALTELLAPEAKELFGIEIDADLFRALISNPELKQCTFLNRDFLKVDLSSLPLTGGRIRVVGNIPYNITSPVVFKLLEEPWKWWDIHLMVQKEVADRMTAPPGGKVYGRLSVMVQARMEVRQVLKVPPEVFVPKPRVRSVVVALKGHDRYRLDDKEVSVFEQIVRESFSQRRKMIKNSLHSFLPYMESMDELSVSKRPETLSVDDFTRLARHIADKME